MGADYHFNNGDHIPHVHSHGVTSSWGGGGGKPFPPSPQPRPPQYQFRPHHSAYQPLPPPPPHHHHIPPHPPQGIRNTGNYSGGYYEQHGNIPQQQQHQQQHDNYRNWAAPPTGYHHAHKNTQSVGNEPLSLRQVLGEKLEQEIFPGEGAPSVDFSLKDDTCSPSKRWSVSSFPPQISTGHGGFVNGGSSSSSSTWGPGGGHHPSHINNNAVVNSRHSVTVSPFQQGDTAISDLAASWPIWSSPIPSSRQPQSPFSPSSSSTLPPSGGTNGGLEGGVEDGWGRGGTGNSPNDLVELMKSLDIAEHIPALKVNLFLLLTTPLTTPFLDSQVKFGTVV